MSLSINSNIPSLVAQENLNGSGSALSQAITRLSSGKRINSAADDAAGLAISTSLQTQINGLNQGVSNANNGVSLVQTASTGLAQITASLQRIRSLAGEAAGGTLTTANQQALQQEVTQQIAEVNRIASQTQFNGIGLLDGGAGVIQVQVGANVGQTVSLDLSQGVSAASLGGGFVQKGNVLGTITNLNLDANGAETSGAGTITSVNIVSDGNGGFTFTDQNGNAISTTASSALFTSTTTNGVSTLSIASGSALTPANELSAISSAAAAGTGSADGTIFGVISGINIDATTGTDAPTGDTNTITSVSVESDGKGNLKFIDQHGKALSSGAQAALFGTGATPNLSSFANAPTSTIGTIGTGAQPAGTSLANINTLNVPTAVSQIDISSTEGANNALNSIDNALAAIANIQASLGAAQNRFSAIAQSQQNESTDLASAQSQITDADFAQETANLSKAQVLQQAGISVLAQANSQPQQVLKLLQ
jgi:flagellin